MNWIESKVNVDKRIKQRITIDYENNHRDQCRNSWQENYTKLHHDMIETNQNKFIQFKCARVGWGNRVRDILFLFHFSVVTKRVFIINCDVPSPLEKYLEPRNIKWNYKINELELSVRRAYTIKLKKFKRPLNQRVFEDLLKYSVEDTPTLSGDRYHFFLESDIVKYDFLFGLSYPQMMGCSFYYLFKKSNMLQERLDEWREKLGFHENIVIGIHFREGDFHFHNIRNKRIEKKDIQFSFDCAEQVQMKVEKKYSTKKVIWFLAADSETMKKYVKEKYGNKVRHIDGPIEHVAHPSAGNEDAGHLSMFLDYFLLQESDYRLYTGPSSFDNAVDFITLGTENVGSSFYREARVCVMPPSLK